MRATQLICALPSNENALKGARLKDEVIHTNLGSDRAERDAINGKREGNRETGIAQSLDQLRRPRRRDMGGTNDQPRRDRQRAGGKAGRPVDRDVQDRRELDGASKQPHQRRHDERQPTIATEKIATAAASAMRIIFADASNAQSDIS